MKKLLSIFVLTAVITALFWSCNKNKDTAPSLPPASSMSIDFSNFATAAKSNVSDQVFKEIAASDKSNWTLASSVAGIWNLINRSQWTY